LIQLILVPFLSYYLLVESKLTTQKELIMKTTLRSNDLSCPTCVNNIESNLNQTNGISGAKVHFNTGRIEVEHNPETISKEKLVKLVRQSGYEAKISQF